jgi:hypothetical protein
VDPRGLGPRRDAVTGHLDQMVAEARDVEPHDDDRAQVDITALMWWGDGGWCQLEQVSVVIHLPSRLVEVTHQSSLCWSVPLLETQQRLERLDPSLQTNDRLEKQGLHRVVRSHQCQSMPGSDQVGKVVMLESCSFATTSKRSFSISEDGRTSEPSSNRVAKMRRAMVSCSNDAMFGGKKASRVATACRVMARALRYR